jgi:ribosomal protein S6
MVAAEKSQKPENDSEARPEVYEIGYHLVPTLEDSAEGGVSRIRSVIEKAGGNFLAEGSPQRITLAQPISIWNNGRWTKYDQSYFGWIKFELDAAQITAVEKALKEDREVLRSIVFKTIREDIRAQVRQFVLKEVKRSDTIKSSLRRASVVESSAEISDEKIDEAIAELVAD